MVLEPEIKSKKVHAQSRQNHPSHHVTTETPEISFERLQVLVGGSVLIGGGCFGGFDADGLGEFHFLFEDLD